jgi:hypothetical protein
MAIAAGEVSHLNMPGSRFDSSDQLELIGSQPL